MARQATGELHKLATGYEARITIQGRDRRAFMLPTCADEETATERKNVMATMAARLRRAGHIEEIEKLLEMAARAKPGKGLDSILAAVDHLCAGTTADTSGTERTTFAAFAKEWTSGDLHKRFPDHVPTKDAGRDEELLRLYILDHVGQVPLASFTLQHAEIVMANLPDTMSAATRRHVAQVVGRVMSLAVYPGRHRSASPIPRGWLPKPGKGKAKECLFPDEDARLLACTEVPLLRRLAYGILSREGLRTDELASLRWRDVDLDRGRLVLDENKTDDARDWDLDPAVWSALMIWRKHFAAGVPLSERVCSIDGVGLNVDRLAEQLRRDLETAKVDRPQLFERSAHRQPIRAHDLRATFVTVSLATGKTETWVADRTGHTSSDMINRYRRRARSWSAMKQGALVALDQAIPELAEAFTRNKPEVCTPALANEEANSSKVHGKGLEPPRLAAAEPKSAASAISPPVLAPVA